jgi:hypothetical protein
MIGKVKGRPHVVVMFDNVCAIHDFETGKILLDDAIRRELQQLWVREYELTIISSRPANEIVYALTGIHQLDRVQPSLRECKNITIYGLNGAEVMTLHGGQEAEHLRYRPEDWAQQVHDTFIEFQEFLTAQESLAQVGDLSLPLGRKMLFPLNDDESKGQIHFLGSSRQLAAEFIYRVEDGNEHARSLQIAKLLDEFNEQSDGPDLRMDHKIDPLAPKNVATYSFVAANPVAFVMGMGNGPSLIRHIRSLHPDDNFVVVHNSQLHAGLPDILGTTHKFPVSNIAEEERRARGANARKRVALALKTASESADRLEATYRDRYARAHGSSVKTDWYVGENGIYILDIGSPDKTDFEEHSDVIRITVTPQHAEIQLRVGQRESESEYTTAITKRGIRFKSSNGKDDLFGLTDVGHDGLPPQDQILLERHLKVIISLLKSSNTAPRECEAICNEFIGMLNRLVTRRDVPSR